MYKINKYDLGSSTRAVYEEIIKTKSTCNVKNNKPTKRPKNVSSTSEYHQQIKNVEFNEKAFFQAAINDDAKWLKAIDWHQNDINTKDQFGWSAAMMASCEGSKNAFEFLCKNGADLLIADKKGNTALSLASVKNHKAIINIIELNGNKTEVWQTGAAVPTIPRPFFCADCQQNFSTVSQKEHETSTLHLFNQRNVYRYPRRYGIPDTNVGFKLMLKLGWDRESGLGPENDGLLYPVKTTLRKSRSGLGIKQDAPRVTHFSAYDRDAIKWRPPQPKPKTRRDLERDSRRDRRKEIRLRNALS